ncbi:MAG TPA: response regulator [Ferruginibacter sp.]|nr:response regulator [Ferruginibacter sp.]
MLQPETKEKSLLIVDDSILIVQRLTGLLKEAKVSRKVFTAENYNEAVKIIDENKPAIVLLDIQLPGKNGIDLLRWINQEYPAIKVVMITNQVSEYYQRLCKEIGAVGFVDKSKDFDLIPKLIREL